MSSAMTLVASPVALITFLKGVGSKAWVKDKETLGTNSHSNVELVYEHGCSSLCCSFFVSRVGLLTFLSEEVFRLSQALTSLVGSFVLSIQEGVLE